MPGISGSMEGRRFEVKPKGWKPGVRPSKTNNVVYLKGNAKKETAVLELK